MEVVLMGFSVSGAAAIIFISILLAFGVWFAAASNSFDMVTDAQDDRADRSLSAENTGVSDTQAVYNETTGTLTINVTNTGTTALSLSETDLLIDGEYIADWQGDADIAGDTVTDLWLSNEQLTVTLEWDTEPSTVKLVTASGVDTQTAVETVSAPDNETDSEDNDSVESVSFPAVSGGGVYGI